jgi:hypothetical protein
MVITVTLSGAAAHRQSRPYRPLRQYRVPERAHPRAGAPLRRPVTARRQARTRAGTPPRKDEQAQNHVQAGNIAQSVQVILDWLDSIDTRQPTRSNVVDMADREVDDALARSFR